jgi:hypothetical protein
MDTTVLRELLEEVRAGHVAPDDAIERLRGLPFEDMGFAKIDHHRALRKGFPEVIFAQGKTPAQVEAIFSHMRERGSNVLATRCSPDAVRAVLASQPDAVHNEDGRTVHLVQHAVARPAGYVALLSAGTSDIPVAQEAAVTCEVMGLETRVVHDVGVAGIHRLFEQRHIIEGARALIVCAGMEGALPSVVAGLADVPVIAVPTSVGYGASFGGVTALLAMLNSCATGVAVVNIDNGFGAAALAALTLKAADKPA